MSKPAQMPKVSRQETQEVISVTTFILNAFLCKQILWKQTFREK